MPVYDEWEKFLGNVRRLAEAKPDAGYTVDKSETVDLVNDVIEGLTQSDAQIRTQSAIGELDRANKNLLERELELFNNGIDRFDINAIESEEEAIDAVDNRLNQAKNVKDSFERLLPLPRWMRRLLHILNELLSLITTI